jgi:hypothetical protein
VREEPGVFARLDQIPWSELQQAHGHAGHVPAAVRGLLSEDEREVTAAYWRLDNAVVLQSDLYEAAAYLPDILIELLDHATPAGKAAILNLLFEIGNGFAPSDRRLRFLTTADGKLTPITAGPGPSLQETCRRGVAAGIGRYRQELQNPDLRVRRAASDLVASFADGAGR